MDKQTDHRNESSSKSRAAVEAASKAAQEIERALEDLPLNDAWTTKERRVATGYAHVPAEALEVALDFLARNPGRYPDFDREAAREALDYAAAMSRVVQLADELSSRVRVSMRMQRLLPAMQVLTLYAAMKHASKHDGSLTDIVSKMGPLVRTNKHRRAKGKPAGSTEAATVTSTPPLATAPSSTTY